MGIFKKVKRSEDLRANGRRGTARVLSSKLLNRGEFQVSGRRAEQLMSGEATMTTLKLELEVTVDADAPYTVKLEAPVPMMELTKVTAGTVLPVLVDRRIDPPPAG